MKNEFELPAALLGWVNNFLSEPSQWPGWQPGRQVRRKNVDNQVVDHHELELQVDNYPNKLSLLVEVRNPVVDQPGNPETKGGW